MSVATEGYPKVCGLGHHHLGPRWCSRLYWLRGHAYCHVSHRSHTDSPVPPPGTMVTSKPGLLPRTMSGPMVLPEMWSALMSLAHVATRDYIDVHGLGCNL